MSEQPAATAACTQVPLTHCHLANSSRAAMADVSGGDSASVGSAMSIGPSPSFTQPDATVTQGQAPGVQQLVGVPTEQ
jgi:hypothetical protein